MGGLWAGLRARGWGWARGVRGAGNGVAGQGRGGASVWAGLRVKENICKFAKKGYTPSQIGVILRDSHGIAQAKSVTGSKILRIHKATVPFCLCFEIAIN
ncbi:40S ribosomal protein S13 [Bienertia sinuspersici]